MFYFIDYTSFVVLVIFVCEQLHFIYLTDDEAMKIYKCVITLNKYILYYLTSTFPIIFVVSN